MCQKLQCDWVIMLNLSVLNVSMYWRRVVHTVPQCRTKPGLFFSTLLSKKIICTTFPPLCISAVSHLLSITTYPLSLALSFYIYFKLKYIIFLESGLTWSCYHTSKSLNPLKSWRPYVCLFIKISIYPSTSNFVIMICGLYGFSSIYGNCVTLIIYSTCSFFTEHLLYFLFSFFNPSVANLLLT